MFLLLNNNYTVDNYVASENFEHYLFLKKLKEGLENPVPVRDIATQQAYLCLR